VRALHFETGLDRAVLVVRQAVSQRLGSAVAGRVDRYGHCQRVLERFSHQASVLYESAYDQWFNPREGQFTNIGTFRPKESQWVIPDRPTAEDWVLLVKLQAQATR
jgi:hypothetical protein